VGSSVAILIAEEVKFSPDFSSHLRLFLPEPELQIKAPGRLIDAFPDLRGFAESSDAGQLELR